MGDEKGSRSGQNQKPSCSAAQMADLVEIFRAIVALQSGLELGPYGQAFIPGCDLGKGSSLSRRPSPRS